MIKSPEKYAGRTLEKHLQLYDWKNEYDAFDRIIKTSSFDGICNSAVVSSPVSLLKLLLKFDGNLLIALVSFEQVSGTPANIVKPYTSPDSSCPTQDINTNSVYKFTETTSNDIDEDDNVLGDNGKSKVTRHSPTYNSLELSSSSSQLGNLSVVLVAVVSLAVNLRYL